MAKRIKKRDSAPVWMHALMILFSICCIVPLLLILGISLTGEKEIMSSGYRFIPNQIDFEAYKYVFRSSMQLMRAYGVTVSVTVVGTIISLFFTSMLAYTMSRKRFFLHRGISFMVFLAMLLSAGVVPWYIVISKWLKLKNNFWALILPYVIVPWYVMLLKGFFASVPDEIIESANIDGAGDIRTFFQIVVPISKPALTTVGLFIALQYWNDYRMSLYFITDQDKVSLQYMLQRIVNNVNFMRNSAVANAGITINMNLPSESARMAMCILAAGPMLIIFPFFQRYFVKGITVGALKG